MMDLMLDHIIFCMTSTSHHAINPSQAVKLTRGKITMETQRSVHYLKTRGLRTADDDGRWIDCSGLARSSIFQAAVTVSRDAWNEAVACSEADFSHGQDEITRAWDLIWMAAIANRRSPELTQVQFRVNLSRWSDEKQKVITEVITLKLVLSKGPLGELTYSIMLPQETLL